MDATGPSPRGSPPVAWANHSVARPRRASQFVSRRNKIRSSHPLSSVKLAAGQTVTAGDEKNVEMTLDFTAVCGSQAQQMLDGRIDVD
eukprot:6799243-Pyramimonas_sp.AAC.1